MPNSCVYVTLVSKPAGATIFADGTNMGITPKIIDQEFINSIPSGSNTFKLTYRGYQDATLILDLAAKKLKIKSIDELDIVVAIGMIDPATGLPSCMSSLVTVTMTKK